MSVWKNAAKWDKFSMKILTALTGESNIQLLKFWLLVLWECPSILLSCIAIGHKQKGWTKLQYNDIPIFKLSLNRPKWIWRLNCNFTSRNESALPNTGLHERDVKFSFVNDFIEDYRQMMSFYLVCIRISHEKIVYYKKQQLLLNDKLLSRKSLFNFLIDSNKKHWILNCIELRSFNNFEG